MARTETEVYNEMVAAKDADPVLSVILTSQSKASFWQSLFRLYAFVAAIFEQTFDAFLSSTDALLESKQVQTSAWWRRVSLAFQLGDPIVILDNGNLGYSIIDTDKQIVQRAAVITPDTGAITLKVAKIGVDGITPEPLGSSELAAFNAYTLDIVPAGLVVTVVSINGDEIKIVLEVEIDAQVINVDDGTLLTDGATKPVENAIYDYFSVFQNAQFGGVFFANKLLSAILSANGVVNATFTSLEKKAETEGSFVDVLALSGKSFVTLSGYVKNAVGYDLSANITYTAS